MAVTLQQILQEHFDDFADRHPLSADMRRAAQQMRDCRTAALGGHVNSCPNGCVHRIAYNSCRHRSCPQCSLLPREQWLAYWKLRLLACPHVHAIFTTPHDLLPLWRYNKRDFANALFAAASGSLLELLADEKYLGARPGLLAALHTWSQLLALHVHLHVLITCGGLTDEGTWVEAKKSCLLPRKVLMIKFRGKLRAELLKALQRGDLVLPPETTEEQWRSLLNKLGRTVWNVKLMQRYDHGVGVATYLANYLKGGPIGNHRLTGLRDGRVFFRYRVSSDAESGRGRREETSLTVDEFLSRLLEHVPPKGFKTVRGFGLYVNNRRERLNAARAALDQAPVPHPLPSPPTWQEICARMGKPEAAHCPHCGALLESHSPFGRGRSPPPPYDELVRGGAAA